MGTGIMVRDGVDGVPVQSYTEYDINDMMEIDVGRSRVGTR